MFETKKAAKYIEAHPEMCVEIRGMVSDYIREWPESDEEDRIGYVFDAFISMTSDENGNSPYDGADEVKIYNLIMG